MQEIIGLLVVIIWIGGAIYDAMVKKKIIKEKQQQPGQPTQEQDEYKRYLEEVKRKLQQMTQVQETVIDEIAPAQIQEPEPKAEKKEIRQLETTELVIEPIKYQSVSLDEKIFQNKNLTTMQKILICKEIFGPPRTTSILNKHYLPVELFR